MNYSGMSNTRLKRSITKRLVLILTLFFGQELAYAKAPSAKKAPNKSDDAKKNKSKNGKKSKTEKNAEAPIEPTTSDASTTESGKSKIELLGNIGFAPLPSLGFGLSGALVSATGNAFEGSFTYSKGNQNSIAYSISHLGGRFRKSLFKIGYIAAGTGVRMASGKWKDINIASTEEYDVAGGLNALTIDSAVGAQMQFGSIVLGADIVGISYPLVKFGVKTAKPEAEDLDTDDADNQQKKFNDIAGGLNLTVLKIGLGFRF